MTEEIATEKKGGGERADKPGSILIIFRATISKVFMTFAC